MENSEKTRGPETVQKAPERPSGRCMATPAMRKIR